MSFLEAHFLWLDIVIAAAAIAAAAGAIGVHTTLRRVVFMPAALSQLAGAGVVVAFLLAHALAQAPEPAPSRGTAVALPAGGTNSSAPHAPKADAGTQGATETEPPPIPMADDPNVFADEPEGGPFPMADDPNVIADEPAGSTPVPEPDRIARSGNAHRPSMLAAHSPDHAGGAATDDRRSTRQHSAVRAAVRVGSADDHCDCPPMLPRALAVLFACLGALLLGFVREGSRVTREWLLGTVFIGASAVVLLLGGFIQQELHDISDVLFGNAIVIASGQMVEAVVVSAVILALHLGLAPSFLVHAFDPLTARAHGVPVQVLDGLLFLSMGVAIATGTRVVGALPEFAFAVFPAMTALSIVRRPRLLIGMAALAGALAAFLGYWASFALSLPTGASMAAASLLIFLVVKGAVVAGLK